MGGWGGRWLVGALLRGLLRVDWLRRRLVDVLLRVVLRADWLRAYLGALRVGRAPWSSGTSVRAG